MRSDIKVCLLKDYFWNNNSFVYPNTVPPLALYKRIENIIPIFISPRSLTCVIEGDFNSAVYLGKYYRMIKLSVKDVDRQIFKYQLEEDIMMNFLLRGGKVKGTLTKTNKTDLLEEHLQNTKPYLDNPREIVYLKYSTEGKFNWKQKAVVTIPVKVFEDIFFTQKSLGQLLWNLSNNEVILAAKEKRLYKYADKDIYILAYTEGEKVSSWKNTVLEKIREAFKTLEGKVITSPNKLPGHWSTYKAISPADASIGSAEEATLIIREINLAGLKDIIPVDLNSGKRWTVGHPVPELNVSGIEIISKIDRKFCRKLSRKTYLPLYTGEKNLPKDAFLPVKSSYYEYLDNSVYTGYTGCEPQVLRLKNDSVGYLWYVDYLNFAFVDGSTFYPSESIYSKRCLPAVKRGGSNYNSAYIFSSDDDNNPPANKLPGLGFLIYELKKERDLWEGLVTYKGGVKLTNIAYRSGINNELFNIYSRASWSNLPDDQAPFWAYSSYKNVIEKINGLPELSYLTLDIDLLLWLYIAPCCAGGNYDYQYRFNNDWGYRDFLVNYSTSSGVIYYTSMAVKADLGIRKPNNETIIKRQNPYSKQRIDAWMAERAKKLEKISLSSTISIPYGVSTGDIFTTDLTHKWTDISPLSVNRGHEEVGQTVVYSSSHAVIAVGGTILTLFTGPLGILATSIGLGLSTAAHAVRDEFWWSQVFYTDHVLQDLFRGDKTNISDIDGHIVIFLHDNKLKYGVYREYKQTQTLSTNVEQVVSAVDGEKERITTFFHIQQLPENVIEGKLTDTQIRAINEEQNKLYGGGVYTNYSVESLSDGAHMFKLEGTPWYAYFSSGHISLLTEDPTIFIKEIGNYAELDIPSELSSKSIYSKMNQKASLIVYGNEIVLNTKFKFDESDSLPITDKPLNPDQTQTTIEYKLIEGGNKNDFISQWFGVPKKGLKSTESINAQEIASLQLQLKHQNQNYHLEKWANELAVREKMRGFKRQREDADFDLAQNILGTVGNAVSLGALTSVPVISGGAENLFMRAKGLIGAEGSRVNPLIAAKHAMFSGKYLGSITSAAGSVMAGIPRMVQHAWIKSRISEDEQHFVQQNALSMFTRDMRYAQERDDRILKLNSISSSYVKAEVTDRDVFTEYTKIKGVGDIYIQTVLPSTDQEVEIEYIVENFGAECIIPLKTPLYVYDGMAPILVQFNRLEKEGVSLVDGILSAEEHEALSQVFESGVKFIKFSHLASKEVLISYFTPEESEPQFNTDVIDKWTKETWDQYVALKDKTEIQSVLKTKEHYGLTKEEYEKNKDRIHIETLFDDINTIIRGRGGGDIVILHAEDKAEIEREKIIKPFLDDIRSINAEKATIQEELRQCKINVENLNNAKNTCDLINANRIKELERNITAATNRADTLSREYKDLETKKTEQENLANLYKAQVETLKKQAKETDCGELIRKHEEEKQQMIEGVEKYKEQLKQEQEQMREVFNKLLEDAKQKEVDSGSSALSLEACKLLRKYLTQSYTIDLKQRDDGSNALRDLVIFLVRSFKVMREDHLDQHLSRLYKESLLPFLDYSMKFLEIPLVSKWEEIISTGGWNEYQAWLKNGGQQSGKVKTIVALLNEITGGVGGAFSLENVSTAHGIKALLDEMNWITYKAKTALSEQIKTDARLQYFFTNIYPGKSLPLYTAIFGDPNIELSKRRFLEVGSCEDNPPKLSTLLDIDKTTNHTIEDIAEHPDGYSENPRFDKQELTTSEQKITVGVAPKYTPNEFLPLPITPLEQARAVKSKYKISTTFKEIPKEHNFTFSWVNGKVKEWKVDKMIISENLACYMSVEKQGLWNSIMTQRSTLWSKRKSLSIPADLNDFTWKRTIRLWYLTRVDSRFGIEHSAPLEIDLMEIFGAYYAVDAAIILSILNSNKLILSMYKESKGKKWIRFKETKIESDAMEGNKEEIRTKVFVEKYPPDHATEGFAALRGIYKIATGTGLVGVQREDTPSNSQLKAFAMGTALDTENTWFSNLLHAEINKEVSSAVEMVSLYRRPQNPNIPDIPQETIEDYAKRYEGQYINLFFEFGNVHSLVNYIWRQIKANTNELENPFSTTFSRTNTLDFPSFLDKVYEENTRS